MRLNGRAITCETGRPAQTLWRERPTGARRFGFTQEKLGERADLNPQTIQKIDAGRLNIFLTTIYRLQSALGCTWQRILGKELKRKAG
jgi:DNA-binding XRE family transcriptional regulator